MDKLGPAPDVGTDAFKQWLFKLRETVNTLAAPVEAATFPISSGEAIDLTDGGDSSLHYHSSDRERSNHTGTQTADTISDLDSFVQSRIQAQAATSTDILATQVFGG